MIWKYRARYTEIKMMVRGRPLFLKLQSWEEVVLCHQIIHMLCGATRDCAHCIAFDGQCVTLEGVQYFTWCGSREDNLFLQRISEILICIRYCCQAESLTKNLIPETPSSNGFKSPRIKLNLHLSKHPVWWDKLQPTSGILDFFPWEMTGVLEGWSL